MKTGWCCQRRRGFHGHRPPSSLGLSLGTDLSNPSIFGRLTFSLDLARWISNWLSDKGKVWVHKSWKCAADRIRRVFFSCFPYSWFLDKFCSLKIWGQKSNYSGIVSGSKHQKLCLSLQKKYWYLCALNWTVSCPWDPSILFTSVGTPSTRRAWKLKWYFGSHYRMDCCGLQQHDAIWWTQIEQNGNNYIRSWSTPGLCNSDNVPPWV